MLSSHNANPIICSHIMAREDENTVELLKNMYNPDSLREFALAVQATYNPFPVEEFLQSTMDKTWNGLELKARGRQITTNLGKYLPADYNEAIGILDRVLLIYNGPCICSFPDFVEVFGQDEEFWNTSINALARYTSHASSEMAVRPFIIRNEERMMAQMNVWSKHENEHIRRLSSEGCRPLLPWAQVLTNLKKDPSPILPILERLKADPSMYVRNSVANNINDISKTHPDLVIRLAKEWYGKNEHTDWIIKHGCRTLLKKANSDVLAIFGYQNTSSVEVGDLAIDTASISIGEDISFSFTLFTNETTKVRLEYGIDYVKANGKRNRKIFQISEISLKKNEKKNYVRKHSFADLSTRRHYPGGHTIALIVNGAERGTLDFELKPTPNQW